MDENIWPEVSLFLNLWRIVSYSNEMWKHLGACSHIMKKEMSILDPMIAL